CSLCFSTPSCRPDAALGRKEDALREGPSLLLRAFFWSSCLFLRNRFGRRQCRFFGGPSCFHRRGQLSTAFGCDIAFFRYPFEGTPLPYIIRFWRSHCHYALFHSLSRFWNIATCRVYP